MKNTFYRLLKPAIQSHWTLDLLLAIPRMIGCYLLFSFGWSKFPCPDWFVLDIHHLGFPFARFFAWCAVLTEVLGSVLLIIGLATRYASFSLIITMLVAVFLQKWDTETWEKLPALGFLWIGMIYLVLGSGRWGLDYLITRKKSM
jgi:putative oxidoreductase